VKDFADTMSKLYAGDLPSVNELKLKQQEAAQKLYDEKELWKNALELPEVKLVISKLEKAVAEALLTLENVSADNNWSDAQVRLFLVRYTTLKRTLNAVNNNAEIL
jgi:hypothetical protein